MNTSKGQAVTLVVMPTCANTVRVWPFLRLITCAQGGYRTSRVI